MADLTTLDAAPRPAPTRPARSRRPRAPEAGALPDYVLPRFARRDPNARVLEMDRVLFVESRASEPPLPCTARVTENMLMVVLDGKKTIEAGPSSSR